METNFGAGNVSVLESRADVHPTKDIRIGGRTFDIAGVSAADPYFSALGDGYEPEFERLCDDLLHYDYVCADVGANIGMKTLLLSQYVPQGRVLAIEPAPTIGSLLERNIACSGYQNITVAKTAIGDSDGTVNFNEHSAYGHISNEGAEKVSVRKLSSLVTEFKLQRLDFVKIDVEGYEFQILKSSIELLNHHQSLVLLEFNAWCQIALANVNPKEFAEWIFSHFTNVFRIHRGAGDGYLQRLSPDGALHFLHTNFVDDGVVSDLLVTNFEGRLAPVPNRLKPELKAATAGRDAAFAERDVAIAARDAAFAERDVAIIARDAAFAERDVAIIARDAALAERDALLGSNSWRITTPLRAVSRMNKKWAR